MSASPTISNTHPATRTIGTTVWRNLESVKTRSPSLTADVIISLTRVGNFVPQCFLHMTKDLAAGYMLARLVWKSGLEATSERGGWSWEISEEMKAEFYVNRRGQVRARRILRALGVLEEDMKGVPAKLHMRINWDGLAL